MQDIRNAALVLDGLVINLIRVEVDSENKATFEIEGVDVVVYDDEPVEIGGTYQNGSFSPAERPDPTE